MLCTHNNYDNTDKYPDLCDGAIYFCVFHLATKCRMYQLSFFNLEFCLSEFGNIKINKELPLFFIITSFLSGTRILIIAQFSFFSVLFRFLLPKGPK